MVLFDEIAQVEVSCSNTPLPSWTLQQHSGCSSQVAPWPGSWCHHLDPGRNRWWPQRPISKASARTGVRNKSSANLGSSNIFEPWKKPWFCGKSCALRCFHEKNMFLFNIQPDGSLSQWSGLGEDLCTHFRRPADLQMASCLIVGHPIPTIGDDLGSFVYGIFDGFILSVYHPLVYYHVHLCQVMMCPFNGQVVLHRHCQTPNKTCSWWCIPLYLLSIHIESREILTGIMCSIHVILLLHVG